MKFNLIFTCRLVVVIVIATLLCTSVRGQAVDESGHRRLAPGVVTTIEPDIKEDETFSGPREIVELVHGAPQLDWQPRYSTKSDTLLTRAKSTIFRRQIWALEFGFKPLRMIKVDIPQPDGSEVTRDVIYLVYFVRNTGRHLNPTPQLDDEGRATYTVEPVDHSIRFFPNMVLQCHDIERAYLDKVIPEALARIRRREDPRRRFYDSVTISSVDIPVSTELEDRSVWGIATWVGVDPRSDFFSIYIQGLTNAYRFQDPPGEFKPGDAPGSGRRFSYKTLQLNFWRPGDAIDTRDSEFRYGMPNMVQIPPGRTEDRLPEIYHTEGRVDYQWIYR